MAAVLTPGFASPYTFKAIAHNIAGGTMHNGDPSALDDIVAQIASWDPDVVMAEEVCESQYDWFRQTYPTWTALYVPMRTNHPDSPNGVQGQMLASKWPMTAPYPAYDLGDDDTVVGRNYTLLVGDVQTPAGDVRCGVTHLRAFSDPEGVAARIRQCGKIRDFLQPQIFTQNKALVIGGDFNCTPKSDALDAIYRLTQDDYFTGPGAFHECDQTDPPVPNSGAHRSGQDTHGGSKFDYVFFSRNRTSGRDSTVSGGVIATTNSDHSLLRGKGVIV